MGVGDLVLAGHHQRHPDGPGLRSQDDRRAQGRPVLVHRPHEEDGHKRVHPPNDGWFNSLIVLTKYLKSFFIQYCLEGK